MVTRQPASMTVVSEETVVAGGSIRPYQVVEVADHAGNLLSRYSRYLNSEGTGWVRHGVWQQFGTRGGVTSQGQYAHGAEVGLWEDFHESGQVAARGRYENGQKIGRWEFWDEAGNPEDAEEMS